MKKIIVIPYKIFSRVYEGLRRSYEYVFEWAVRDVPSIPLDVRKKQPLQDQKNNMENSKDLEHRL